MSVERVAVLKQLGAKVVLNHRILMDDAVAQAEAIAREAPGAIVLDRFRNPASHGCRDLGGHGRRGGLFRFRGRHGRHDYRRGKILKQRKPGVRSIAVEPANAAVLSGGPAGNHRIPGIGIGFVAEVLNWSILDEVIGVTNSDARPRVRAGLPVRKES